MKNLLLIYLTVLVSVFLSGCGDTSDPVSEKQNKPHVWTSQTDALHEARKTADDISATLELREKQSRPSD